MAKMIAMKNQAAQALNGEASSDGLNAMLGGEDSLQTMLIKSIKEGKQLKGSTEEWTAMASERAKELLAGIGKKKAKAPSVAVQLLKWAEVNISATSTLNVLKKESEKIALRIEKGEVAGFAVEGKSLSVDLITAFGFDFVPDAEVLTHLLGRKEEKVQTSFIMPTIKVVSVDSTAKKRKKNEPIDGQLGFDLFTDAI